MGHIFVTHHLLMGESWLLRFGQVPKARQGSAGTRLLSSHLLVTLAVGDRALVGRHSIAQVSLVWPRSGPTGVAAFLEGAMTPTSSALHSGFWERKQRPSREAGPAGLTGALGAPGHPGPCVFQHPQRHAEVPGGPGRGDL